MLAMAPLLLPILIILCSDAACLAFNRPTTAASSPRASAVAVEARRGHDDCPDADVPICTRRSALSRGVAASALPLLASLAAPAAPSLAEEGASATKPSTRQRSLALVESWPGAESLEPLYEFRLSVDAIAGGVRDPKNWPFIQRRLEAFFGGFIINEKNYFMGVGLQYMNEIVYDRNELPNYVLLDKEARFDGLDGTMKYLERLKSALAAAAATTGGGDDTAYIAEVEDLASAAQGSLRSFFDLVPEGDVRAVEELFKNVKKADVNGDGRLSESELAFLSPADQELWRRRIDKFGG